MSRWNYPVACYSATLAILLAVVALPLSRWTIANHLDILTGGWGVSGPADGTRENWVEPIRLTGGVFNMSGNANSEFPVGSQIDDLVREARNNPTDAPSLAHVIRYSFLVPHRVADDQPLPRWRGHTIGDLRREALWASDQGTKVDSDNAFFPLSKAILLDWSGNVEGGYDALREASSRSRFDVYANDEANDLYSKMVRHLGYRGEKVRAEYWAGILLPHWAAIKVLAKELTARPQTREVVQAEADLLKTAGMLQRRERYVIGVMVATSISEILLLRLPKDPDFVRPARERNKPIDLTPASVRFRDLQDALKVERPVDPAPIAKQSTRLLEASQGWNQFLDAPLAPAFSWGATVPGPIFLFAVLASCLLGAFGLRFGGRSEMVKNLVPLLAAPISAWCFVFMPSLVQKAWAMSPEFYWGAACPDLRGLAALTTVSAIVLGAMQIWAPLRKPANVLGHILAVVVTFWIYPNMYFLNPGIVYLLAFAMTHAKGRAPDLLVWGWTVLWLLLSGLCTTQLALRGPSDQTTTALSFALLLLVFWSLKGSQRVLRALPAITLVFACAYLGAVTLDIHHNEEVKTALHTWDLEADLLRAKAGIS